MLQRPGRTGGGRQGSEHSEGLLALGQSLSAVLAPRPRSPGGVVLGLLLKSQVFF